MVDHAQSSKDAPDPMVGEYIVGYRIVRLIGRGGMGAVYEAQHETIAQRAAIKVLLPEISEHRASVKRFAAEARAASMVSHPGLAQVFNFGFLGDGTAYLMMEFLNGESLAGRLRRLHGEGRRLPIPAAMEIGRQVAATLDAVHRQGITHRDLKPANLLLVPDPTLPSGERVKVVDFGIAKLHDASDDGTSTTAGRFIGTPRYASPEQCQISAAVGSASDVYSLGVILYEILAGRDPFQANTPGVAMAMHLREAPPPLREHAPDLPEDLCQLVHQMLDKEPALRPVMTEVADRLSPEGPSRSATERLDEKGPAGTAVPVVSRGLPWHWAALLGAVVLACAVFPHLMRGTYPQRPARPQRPAEMAAVPGGTFTMGSTGEEIKSAFAWCQRVSAADCLIDQFEREEPARHVRISPFLLDAGEVTNEHFTAWLNQQGGLILAGDGLVHRDGVLLLDLYPTFGTGGLLFAEGRYQARRGFAQLPVTQVTWYAAKAYCASQGKRLPTEAEWEYAARSTRGYQFPWGDDLPRCEGTVFSRLEKQGCAGQISGPAPVGTMQQDRSVQGVYDLAGNVQEWVADRFVERYPDCGGECSDPVVAGAAGRDPADDGLRVVRGGDWNSPAFLCRAAARGRLPAEAARPNIGFRCARPL